MTVKLVGEVMTRDPITVEKSASVAQAAGLMREHNIGDVLVVDEDGALEGILTDRDIVVRGLAAGSDPIHTPVERICSRGITRLDEGESIEHAFELMRRKAIRRLPVVRDRRPIGLVSLGDLMVHRYPGSTLGKICDAPPNR